MIESARPRPASISIRADTPDLKRQTATALLWGEQGRAVTVYVATTAWGGGSGRRDSSCKLARAAPLSH
jgi:hypothetical protein